MATGCGLDGEDGPDGDGLQLSTPCEPTDIDGGADSADAAVEVADGGDLESADEDASADAEADVAPDARVPPVKTIRDPNGIYFADVRANGTGCPAGTWDTSIAPDGSTFTTTFSAYEVDVDPSRTISVKDCQLALSLRAPKSISYAVAELSYYGYAYLESGVNLALSANYYYSGMPVVPVSARTDLTGPFDDWFSFVDKVSPADMVWSPCGVDRNLNITTRMRLRNATPRRSGYANFTALPSPPPNVKLKLAVRACD